MNENMRYSRLLALSIIMVLLFSALGTLLFADVGNEPETSPSNEIPQEATPNDNTVSPKSHGTRAGSPRTVLAELFTNWGCSPCKYANPAINELLDVYDPSQLVMIAYHTWWPWGNDPFYNYNTADNINRINYYGVGGVPSIFFDGPPNRGNSGSTTYGYYKGFIETELAISSNMTISLEGYLDTATSTGVVNASIEITNTLPIGILKVRFAVVQDNNYAYAGPASPNQEVRHRYVMRDMLAEGEINTFLPIGEFYNVSRSFTIDPIWNLDTISIVVFVQDDLTKDVLQAATYDYIPQKILVVDDDESSHPYGYEDDYHELLCQMGYSFDGWVHNEKGDPSFSDLAPYDVVIWVTGTTSSYTLNASDQLALSIYLDGGTGSLFLCGENVGADIGLTGFFQNYLHSLFFIDDTNDNQITGVFDDPISDPYFGSNLPISSGSPSEIRPFTNARAVFNYSGSGKTGGIRAAHDPDSRIVYFAFLYFESSDSDANKMTVMARVLNWINIDVDYIVIRDGPGETGNIVTNKVLELGDDTTFWAAAYDLDLGLVWNSEFTTWSEDSGGSVITVTLSGPSTFVQSVSYGSSTVTVDYVGMQNTTWVIVPTLDEIKITDVPGGVELTTVILGTTDEILAYASGYNGTIGYYKLVDVNWSDSMGLGSFDNVTGTSTTFTAGILGGLTTITGQNDTILLSDSFEANVTTAKVDYLLIQDASGEGGSNITSLTFDVGGSKQIWSAAYNNSAGFIGNKGATNWSEITGGSVIILNPLTGSSTFVLAQFIEGTSEITAEYCGVEVKVPVTVNPPIVNYILIRDAPDGGGANLCDLANYPDYPVGFTTTFYGAKYNYTADYIGDVPSNSFWINSNPNVVEVSPSGSSSTITCSDTLYGIATIRLNDGLGHECSTKITVLSPTVDFLIIRDSPNGQGNAIFSLWYEVGEEDSFYAASYNDTANYLGEVDATWNCIPVSVGTVTTFGGSTLFNAIGIGKCIVTAEYGGKTDSTGTIIVDDSTPPIADAGSGGTIDEDTSFEFNASASNDIGGIVDYHWSFGDGSYLSGMEQYPSHPYLDPGTYTVILTVTDIGGNTATDEIAITVLDKTPPTAIANLQDFAEEDVPCSFDGSDSYDNAGIVKYIWDFGDGSNYVGNFANVIHTYEEPGNYSVNLTVRDAAGYSDITSSYIIVKDLTPPPKPKGVVIEPLDTGESLEINWKHVPAHDLDHYELYCSEANETFTKIADINAGIATYTHEELENGKKYKYYIIAVDTTGNPSSPSMEGEGIPDIDTDDDGIFNLEDYDDDDDGLSDDQEIQKGSDPLNPDSDGDSHIDGEDAFPTDSKEWKDIDFDGHGDSHDDAFPKDPEEWDDSDGDGIGDNSDFLPSVHNMLLLIIIIVIVIVAIIGTAGMIRRRGREAVPFSAEPEQTQPTTPPSQPQPETKPTQPRSKPLPPPPKSKRSSRPPQKGKPQRKS